MKFAAIIWLVITPATLCCAEEFDLAARATNEFAVDLHKQLATGDDNLCVSPYSIESAMAMTFAGADGETRNEMARVLHLPKDGDAIHRSFASLQRSLEEMATKLAKETKDYGGPSEPITIALANRLFGQTGYDFRDAFCALMKKFYGAPFEPLDFRGNAEGARIHINKWVEKQTREKIHDLIPPGSLDNQSGLVLANAIYLKARWESDFDDGTTPQPFRVHGNMVADVPMMHTRKAHFGYAKHDGYTVTALPYVGRDLQFVVLLPDESNGLPRLEKALDTKMLADCAKLKERQVDLSMPKFKFEPPTIALAGGLQRLGMKTSFNVPPGSANFDKIAPRKPKDYLAISEAFHKTFISVDEKGTEVAATNTVVDLVQGLDPFPVIVKVDHPFLYAIQHVPSGTCLFLGRVTDPR